MKIKNAILSDLEHLVPLFNNYRVFYGQHSNLDAARSFLKTRLSKKESTIFLALYNDKPVGFTQLFKTFSSVSLEPFLILNDLFVTPEFRNRGVGRALLEYAKLHCKELDYKGLALETALDNPAQKLYEQLGWEKDEAYLHYFWKNTGG